MTRKEILNTPEIVDFMIDKSVMVESKMKLHKRLDELCKLAIEALDQEPCEDCISRQALLKLMGEEPFNWTDSDKELQEVEDYRNFRNIVEQLPSINSQKIGHWKEHRNRATGHIETVCSECGAEEGYPYNDYCGNCGAQMFDPQESEET